MAMAVTVATLASINGMVQLGSNLEMTLMVKLLMMSLDFLCLFHLMEPLLLLEHPTMMAMLEATVVTLASTDGMAQLGPNLELTLMVKPQVISLDGVWLFHPMEKQFQLEEG